MSWRMDEMGVMEAGSVGGDVQVGEAWEVRFINPDLPRCVAQITAFVCAPELSRADMPECPHKEPEGWTCRHGWGDLHRPDTNGVRCLCWIPSEHLACSYDMDSLRIDMYTEYAITREGVEDGESPWDRPEWEERSAYEPLDTRPFNRDVDAANRIARHWVTSFDPAHIAWDGKPF